MQIKKNFKNYLSFFISALCIYWVVTSIDLKEVASVLLEMNYFWGFLAFVTTLSGYFLRAYRWRLFFEESKPSFWDSYSILITGFFMNNILPARMGELVRAHLGGKITKQSRSVVLATVFAERLVDGFIISLIFIIGAKVGQLSVITFKSLYLVSLLFIILVIITLLVLFQKKRVFKFLEYLGQIMPGHLSGYTILKLKTFFSGLEPLIELRRSSVILILSVFIWLIELMAYFQVAKAFAVSFSFSSLALYLTVLNFSSLIPSAPGGIGVIEVITTLFLQKIGIARATAFSMVATQHLIQYLVVGLPGLYFFFKLKKKIYQLKLEEEKQKSEEDFVDISSGINANVSSSEDEKLTYKYQTPTLDFSLVIPAYNEEKRILPTILSANNFLRDHFDSFEILIVNDGSSDNTQNVIENLMKDFSNLRIINLDKNKGKGFATKRGILDAKGKTILYADADGAAPIEESSRLLKAIENGANLAIGSRARFSADTKVETLLYRKFLGRIFNGFVNLLILPGVADTQCGFKMFNSATAFTLFTNVTSDNFSFDVEVLFLARKAGCKIIEVPINWSNISGSKVNVLSDSFNMFFDIIKFRLKEILGGYKSSREIREEMLSLPRN